MVEEIVRRSGEMTPLWIEASHWTPNRTRHDDSPRVVRRKLLLKILQDFWPRVEKISVISDLDDYYHTDQRIANIFGSPAPLLKVFKASIPMNFRPESDREAQAELILFSQIAPSLTTFGYDGFHLPNNSPWYSNITRFDTVPGTSLPKKLDKTLKILRLMPLLQYLRILAQDVSLSWSNPEDEEDLFTIDLPCLKCIELSKLGVDQAHEFLRRVKPSPDGCLTNLQLGCSMWEQGNLGNTIIPVLKENVQILYGSDPPKRLCLDIGPFGFRIMDDGTCLDLEWCIGRITVDLDTGIFIELDWKLYSEISDMVGRLSGYDIMDRHIPVISSFFCSSQLRLVTCLRVTELYPQFASVLEPFQDVRLLEVHIGVISELVQAIKLHKEAPEEEFDPQDLFPHLEDLHITMVKGIYYFDAMDDIRDFLQYRVRISKPIKNL
ncbi:hypothetical protein D9613_004638 [Agrocybe pediades]|uniref:Uncharacterized protein n=1 Tax=Agrocybe pediades TaxID=84607 RepID=A0A8H4VTK7_9AGAR|nr:hypothetical protein D9613_004638 [Agrocybe pediades]